MRWKTGRRSSNVEDRRGQSGFPGFGGGRGRMPIRVGRKGIGGIGTIILVLGALYFGVDPSVFLGTGGMSPTPMDTGPSPEIQSRSPSFRSAAEGELADFVSVVLADTEDTWNALFGELDARYLEPTLVLFSGSVRSACGFAQAAMGPFYCPADQKVSSIYPSMMTCVPGTGRPATSHRPMSSHTRWAITSRTCSGSQTRSILRGNG